MAPTVDYKGRRDAIMRQYERLLMQRSRFQLADVIQSLQPVLHELCGLQELLAKATPATQTSSKQTTTLFQRQQHTKATFVSVMDNITRRLEALSRQIPLFFSDVELARMQQALHEFVSHSDLERFWDLDMTAKEKALADDVLLASQALTRVIKPLDATVAAAAMVTSELQRKREHFVRTLKEFMALHEAAESKRREGYELEVKQLMTEFEAALHVPALENERRLEHEIDAITATIYAMLETHMDICLAIKTANAQLNPSAPFDTGAREQIATFVDLTTQIKQGKTTLDSAIADVSNFLEHLERFEDAATQDAFAVLSTALKLEFTERLDVELFRAYLQDLGEKRNELQNVRESHEFQAATARVADLEREILRVESIAISRRRKDDANDPIRDLLKMEIVDLFADEGGDAQALVDALF
ncbi:hypothetical protein PINS_up002620 [Pythium insidiosum]|nr:hypothetical protein PINS_up002620 [Pythium insidiosum]